MINVCQACGMYRADQIASPQAGSVACPECGSVSPWRFRPLLLVGGASGTGKTALCRQLTLDGCRAIPLEGDILWNPYFDRPDENYRLFFNTWLRLAKNIAQCGEPAVLFGAGFAVPANIEGLVERRYFGATHYLALVCEPGELAARLQARPAWRQSSGQAFLRAQLDFNRWLIEQADRQSPPVSLLDTSNKPLAESAAALGEWIGARLSTDRPSTGGSDA